MWNQFLESDEDISEEISPSSPFAIRIEGATTQTFKVYSRRSEGDYDEENVLVVDSTPYLVYSFPDTFYELRASSSGASAYWAEVLTSQTDRTRGR